MNWKLLIRIVILLWVGIVCVLLMHYILAPAIRNEGADERHAANEGHGLVEDSGIVIGDTGGVVKIYWSDSLPVITDSTLRRFAESVRQSWFLDKETMRVISGDAALLTYIFNPQEEIER